MTTTADDLRSSTALPDGWLLDFELFDDGGGRHVSVGWGGEDRDGVDGCPAGVDLVEFGFLTEVHEGLVVVWGIGWDGCDNASTLSTKGNISVY